MSAWANGWSAVPKTVYAGSIPAVDTYALVAQLVEQRILNPRVQGSSPCERTMLNITGCLIKWVLYGGIKP